MLSKDQIHQIATQIRKQRLKSFAVEDELIDFVACKVQERTAMGESFNHALNSAMAELEAQPLTKIHNSNPILRKPNSVDMFQNYLKIALRNFTKYKANSAINVFGLVLSLSAAIIIGLYLKHEFSYDNMHADVDRLYRVNTISHMGQTPRHMYSTAPQLVPAVLEDIPEVESATSLMVNILNKPLKWREKAFFEYRMSGVHQAFVDMFDLTILKGDASGLSNGLNNVLVSESMSDKIFGNEDPLDEIITINSNDKDHQFKVIGIYADLPSNSHFDKRSQRFDLLTSMESHQSVHGAGNWRSTWGPAYIKLKSPIDQETLNAKINEMLKRRAGEDIWYEHYAQPVRNIHLNQDGYQIESEGDLKQLYVFAIIGVLILLIACINYINLTTAQASVRLKEVGIRKVIGAKRKQFVTQFLVEASLLSGLSMVLAAVLVNFMIPIINSNFSLNLGLSLGSDVAALIGFFLLMFLVSVLCGVYPGFYLSRLSPSHLLRSSGASKSGGGFFRKVLVALQYATSIALVIATLIILDQLRFMSKQDLGFEKEEVIYIKMGSDESKKYGETLLSEIEKLPGVVATSLTGNSLGDGSMSGNGVAVGETAIEDGEMHQVLAVDYEYLSALRLELTNGRWFSEDFGTDRKEGYVVNEALVKHFGLTDPIGVRLSRNGSEGKIVGVVGDFHFKSMRHSIEPLVMHMAPRDDFAYWNMAVRLSPTNAVESLAQLEATWQSVVPDVPFKFEFLDQKVEAYYKSDKDFATMFSVFSMLAISVSCLGLIGLVAFTTQRRSKEIGIRKVLGATVAKILSLISRDFVKLIAVGAVVAIPSAYFFSQNWLQGFEYRIEVSYWTFAIGLISTIIISWVSVSYISLKAAKANPVDSLRSE